MVSMKDAGITITNMRDPANKSPLSWEEFRIALLEDEKTRDFAVKTEAEKKEKPRKVEKSKVAPAQPKSVQKEPKNEEKCPNPSENAQKTSEIEKVEGEVVEETAMNPPEDPKDDIKFKLLEETLILKDWIQKKKWRNAADVANDIADRCKRLCL